MRRIIYAVLAAYLSIVIGAGVTLWYANYINRDSNQRWCDLLSTLDSAYSSTPPTTELGRRVAQSIDNLRRDFECG